MPFKEGSVSPLASGLVEAAMFELPLSSDQVEQYALAEVEKLNVERRKAGYPDLIFLRVELGQIVMRDPMPMSYVSGSNIIL